MSKRMCVCVWRERERKRKRERGRGRKRERKRMEMLIDDADGNSLFLAAPLSARMFELTRNT